MSLNSVVVANKLSIEFGKIARSSTACFIAVGMITDRMFDFACRQLMNCKDLQIICGVHMATTPDVMVKLQQLTDAGKLLSGVFTSRFFHSKLYIFKVDANWIAFVGSGNFTNGGWTENEELFVKITDQSVCLELIAKFQDWLKVCELITDNFISLYKQSFTANTQLEREKKKNISNFIDKLKSNFNIDNIDFFRQFFKKEDVLAFQPGKTHLDTEEVLAERQVVRNKLFLLNDLLAGKIPASWHLEPHYKTEHTVSHIETKNHHDFNVRSLWVGYGRTETQLKKYAKYPGLNNTPLFFMRMQVIVSYDRLGIWLMPGKNNAGHVDRENFLAKMEEAAYCQKFFDLLTGLGKPYYIEVADDLQPVTSFKNPQELKDFVDRDNWRYYYFIIGRDYQLDDKAISEANIASTALSDFSKYFPMYEMIRDRSFG